MLMDDKQLHEGSVEGALGDEVHEVEQEGGEEEVLGVIPGGGSEVPPEMENVGEGPPITLVLMKVGPSLGMGYVTPAFVAPGSTSSHVIIPERNWSLQLQLSGASVPDQLSCDNYPFFEGLHPLSSGVGFLH